MNITYTIYIYHLPFIYLPAVGFLYSFIHQVIIITGLNKLQLYVLALKMALDADRA